MPEATAEIDKATAAPLNNLSTAKRNLSWYFGKIRVWNDTVSRVLWVMEFRHIRLYERTELSYY